MISFIASHKRKRTISQLLFQLKSVLKLNETIKLVTSMTSSIFFFRKDRDFA